MVEFPDMSAWLTVDEVARRLRLGEDHVRRLIREKKIKAFKGGKWLVNPTDLAMFLSSRMNVQDGV